MKASLAPSRDYFRSQSPTVRFLIILALAVVLLIPFAFVWGLISSRQNYSQHARESIVESWGKDQGISSPMLLFPKPINPLKEKEYYTSSSGYYCIFPDSVSITSRVRTEVRRRGIFRSIVYVTDVQVTGHYSSLAQSDLIPEGYTRPVRGGYFCVPVSDVVGLDSPISVRIDDRLSSDLSVSSLSDEEWTLFWTPLGNLEDHFGSSVDSAFTFSYSYSLRGSNSLYFTGGARISQVDLSSDWPGVSYAGRRLPSERAWDGDSVSSAQWSVLGANLGLAQVYDFESFSRGFSKGYGYYDSGFNTETSYGVEFVDLLDVYDRVERSLKYVAFILAVTFLSFFFVDTLLKKPFPLIAYLLIGFALILFYLLLVSIAEIVGFGWAFLLSSALVVLMVSIYAQSYLRSWAQSGLLFCIMSVAYALIYTVLNLEVFPLLIGSLVLFALLGFIMYLSRRLEW